MARGVDSGASRLESALERLAESSHLLAQLETIARDTTDVQQIIDQPHHLSGLPLHDAARAAQHRIDDVAVLEEPQAVTQRREWVAQLVSQHGEELVLALIRRTQLLLCSLAFGDVDVHSGKAHRGAAFVVVVTPEGAHPDDVACAAHDAMLDHEVGFPRDGAVKRLAHCRLIVGVQSLAPHIHCHAAVLGRRVAEQLERTLVPIGVAAAQIAVPDCDARAVDDELQAQLALAQRAFCLASLDAPTEMRVDPQQQNTRRSTDGRGHRVHGDRECVAASGCNERQAQAGQLTAPPPLSMRVHVEDCRYRDLCETDTTSRNLKSASTFDAAPARLTGTRTAAQAGAATCSGGGARRGLRTAAKQGL